MSGCVGGWVSRWVNVSLFVHACVRVHTHTNTRTPALTHMHTHTHSHTLTHTHTHTHAQHSLPLTRKHMHRQVIGTQEEYTTQKVNTHRRNTNIHPQTHTAETINIVNTNVGSHFFITHMSISTGFGARYRYPRALGILGCGQPTFSSGRGWYSLVWGGYGQ